MYAAAGVKISSGHLTTRLLAFWSDAADVVLALLFVWLQSGAANSLHREELPAAAVYYIHSERQKGKDNFWPDHGINIDVWCLTTGVVTEERMFHEWTASMAMPPAFFLSWSLACSSCENKGRSETAACATDTAGCDG